MKRLIVLFSFLFLSGIGFSQSDSVQKLEHIFVTEAQPSFPSGESKLFSFINLVKHYPESLKEGGIEGKVYIQFVVKKSGNITNINILRSPDSLLSQEAIRIMKIMPNWKSGINFNGDSVDMRMVLPFNFKINTDEVLQVVETQPTFPGGDIKLFEYLGKNMKLTQKEGHQMVFSYYFEFVIEKNGSISNLKIIKNHSDELYKHISLVLIICQNGLQGYKTESLLEQEWYCQFGFILDKHHFSSFLLDSD